MSFLAPLYVLGALAVSLPVLFHLIRRSPRGRTLFSSLMFLAPSPPRLTRRSRLDHLLLLLLRSAVLILLAAAFARPFLREAARLPLAGAPGKRVAILVDTSASMRRGNLWSLARDRVEKLLEGLEPADEVALFVFDDSVRVLAGFEATGALGPGQRASVLQERLRGEQPTWGATDLGGALVRLADSLDAQALSESADDEGAPPKALQVVAVTDLQQGADLAALEAYTWPERVRLTLERVEIPDDSNAGARLLGDLPPEAADEPRRVRVRNEEGSGTEQFSLAWASGGAEGLPDSRTEVYVPAGETRIVPATMPSDGAAVDRLVLRGDEQDFDNSFYIVPPVRREVDVLYVGRDEEKDPEGLRYYAELAWTGQARREVRLLSRAPDQPLPPVTGSPPPLMLADGAVDRGTREGLLERVRSGATLLYVLTRSSGAPSLETFLGRDGLLVEESDSDDYAMLGEIDFTHPVFLPFADPRYSDFTKIRFWRHRRVSLGGSAAADRGAPDEGGSGVRVLARFDNGDPAVLERNLGEGRILVFTSGWNPRDSQLARSTKFAPLLVGLLDIALGRTRERAAFVVNEPIPFPPVERTGEPEGAGGTGRRVVKPDGTEVLLAADARTFEDADQPGIYELLVPGASRRVAVNLASSESRTAPLAEEELEQRGVALGVPVRSESRGRHLRDVELESGQKLWQWLVAAALALLVVETWIAGRKSRPAVREVVA